MKSLLAIIVLLIASVAGAQELPKDVLKGARAIVIKNSNSIEDNYKNAGNALISLGYGIGESQKDFGTIQSKIFKSNDPIGAAYLQVIEITAQDSIIKISSRYQPLDGDNKNQLIEGVTPMYKPVVFKKKVFGSYGLFQSLLDISSKIDGLKEYEK